MTPDLVSGARRVVLGAFALLAAHAQALDLSGSAERALRSDPSMLAADQAVLAGREKAVQGRALLKPQVTLTASVAGIEQRASVDAPPALQGLVPSESSGTAQQAAVQLVQPLYDAKARADSRQLREQTELAEIEWRQARQDLLQRVGERYFAVLLAEEALRTVEAEKAAVGQQRDRARARFEVGRGKATDLQEAQARYDTVAAREVSARSALALRRAQYRETTGVAADGLAPLAPGFMPTPPTPDDLGAWQARGDAHAARVLARSHELAIATYEIDKHTLAGRPRIDLVASYTYKSQGGGLSSALSPDSSRAAVIGAQLNVPLYSGGAISSRQREAVARKAQAEDELQAARRDMRLQVHDAFLTVKDGVARIAALEQQALSARTALEATTLGRDVGTRTELDVLDAQQRVYLAQLDLAQGRHDYLLGRIRLAAAAGELEEGDLRALDAYLVR